MKHPRMTWLGASLIVRLIVRLRVEGLERLPPGPIVVVGNHRSWIDPPLLIAALGRHRRLVFLAAREHIERRRLLDLIVSWTGIAILVDRASVNQRETLRLANDALAAGGDLVLFPEGKVNVTDDPLLPLEPGTALIARRAGAPIVPLGLAGTRELHFRRQVVVRVGTTLQPGRSRQDDDDVTERLHAALLAAMPPTPPLARRQPGSWLRRLT